MGNSVQVAEAKAQLFEAVELGDVEKLRAVLSQHPHLIDCADKDGFTPLNAAANSGRAHVVEEIEELVRLGSRALDVPDNGGRTPLYWLAFVGNADAIEVMIRLGSKGLDVPTKTGHTPMHVAAENGHANVIEALVRLGSKAIDTPNNDGWTPMHRAAWSGHAKAIKTLVRFGEPGHRHHHQERVHSLARCRP